MPETFTPTPILDQLHHEARTGGILVTYCGESLVAHPGEVYPCVDVPGHGVGRHARDHQDATGHLTW